MHQFNSSNPEFLTFKYEQLLFSIMGGIRLDGLDRMRATLKIEFRSEAVRHNLDLYNDTSTGLINKNLSVENRAYATVHETLHMFGLDDRYFTIEYNNNCKISESHSLYENDIMSLYNEEKSPDKVEFSQTHVDYLVKGALKTVADKRNIVFIDGKNQFSIFKEILGERHFDDSDPLKEATYERRNTDCPKFK